MIVSTSNCPDGQFTGLPRAIAFPPLVPLASKVATICVLDGLMPDPLGVMQYLPSATLSTPAMLFDGPTRKPAALTAPKAVAVPGAPGSPGGPVTPPGAAGPAGPGGPTGPRGPSSPLSFLSTLGLICLVELIR